MTTKKKLPKKNMQQNHYTLPSTQNNGWVVLDNASDIVSLEKKSGTLTIRIEARLVEGTWNIFKTYFDSKNFNHVEEYFAESINETLEMIEKLKNEKELTKSQILSLRRQQKEEVTIQVRRVFKELDSEKWAFTINQEKGTNFFIINYEETIQIDIVLFEKYAPFEKQIISEITKTMGIEKYGVDTEINIYYFSKRKKQTQEHDKKQVMIGKIDIGFNPK